MCLQLTEKKADAASYLANLEDSSGAYQSSLDSKASWVTVDVTTIKQKQKGMSGVPFPPKHTEATGHPWQPSSCSCQGKGEVRQLSATGFCQWP